MLLRSHHILTGFLEKELSDFKGCQIIMDGLFVYEGIYAPIFLSFKEFPLEWSNFFDIFKRINVVVLQLKIQWLILATVDVF